MKAGVVCRSFHLVSSIINSNPFIGKLIVNEYIHKYIFTAIRTLKLRPDKRGKQTTRSEKDLRLIGSTEIHATSHYYPACPRTCE